MQRERNFRGREKDFRTDKMTDDFMHNKDFKGYFGPKKNGLRVCALVGLLCLFTFCPFNYTYQ
jgi:hypothetical protein